MSFFDVRVYVTMLDTDSEVNQSDGHHIRTQVVVKLQVVYVLLSALE